MKNITDGHYIYPKKRYLSFNLIVGTHKTKRPILSGPKSYRIKTISLGDIYEFYEYEVPVKAGYQKSYKAYKRENTSEETKDKNRKKVATRIRNNVRRLSNANFNCHSRFFTATFGDNIVDMNYANKEFKKFIQRIKSRYGDFKYLVVLQFQKRGAIHYHMLADFEYIEQSELERLWGNGFVWINDLLHANKDSPVDNVGAYIIGYMNKNVLDKRLMGKKAYFTSRNLDRPRIYYENIGITECMNKYGIDDSNLVYRNKYKSEMNGMVNYFEFNKKRNIEL